MDPKIKIGEPESATLPPPGPYRPQVRVIWPFAEMKMGQVYRIPRAVGTVKNAIYEFYKTPGNEKKQFIARPITKSLTRVWRTK